MMPSLPMSGGNNARALRRLPKPLSSPLAQKSGQYRYPSGGPRGDGPRGRGSGSSARVQGQASSQKAGITQTFKTSAQCCGGGGGGGSAGVLPVGRVEEEEETERDMDLST